MGVGAEVIRPLLSRVRLQMSLVTALSSATGLPQ